MTRFHARRFPSLSRRRRRRQRHPRIGLFGIFGAGNSGNDGSLETMLLFLRQSLPTAEAVCICTNPGRVAEALGVRSVSIGIQQPNHQIQTGRRRPFGRLLREVRKFARALAICRTLDVLMFPGTGIIDDFGERPSGVPAALFAWCLAAKLAGTKINFVSVGAGPIRNPISRVLMKSAMKLADYRSYRDNTSKTFMESIGLDTRDDQIFPDIVFNLPSPMADRRPSASAGCTIGIGVMSYHGWRGDPKQGDAIYRQYIQKMATFTSWVLEQGYRVRILMGDVGDQKAVNDLQAILVSAKESLPPESIIAEPIANLHELMQQISTTQLVVATRFHNVVCALKLNRPTLSISYSNKNDDLLTDVGLGEYCQSISTLDVDKLKEQFSTLMGKIEQYQDTLAEVNRTYQSLLRLQNSVLLSRLPYHGEKDALWTDIYSAEAANSLLMNSERKHEGDRPTLG